MRFLKVLLLSASAICAELVDAPFVSIIKVSDSIYASNQGKVEIFFEDMNPKHEYQQLAYLTIKGSMNSNDIDVVNRLKYEAWKIGADGVMRIKKTIEDRKYAEMFVPENDQQSYKSTVLTGVAFRYVDSTNRAAGIDSSILISVPASIAAKNEELDEKIDRGISSILVITIGLIIVLIVKVVY
ncbi:MAG: hypothetical protein RL318_1190 [Fibrobacterota bacterium]|jgi:hypothetical protein